MAKSGLDCGQCPVRDRAACAALESDDRENLARSGRKRTLQRGEMLFAAGDQGASCATLISGALKVSNCDPGGIERILALVHPAGFVGELFSPFEHHDVVALTDCEVCVFSRPQFEAAVDKFPELGQALLRRSQSDLHEARQLVELIGRRSAMGKVAGLLLALGHAASHSPCHAAMHYQIPLTRGEMAGMLGVTIETVSRQLTRLEQQGLIARNGARGITLCDPARLEALLEGDGE
jgi:CRP/FNR family transcriptional regulator, anaerobic regulatory protein